MKRKPDQMESILSLVRIINGKLCDVRTNDKKSLELLNDIQNSMDIVEQHCKEVKAAGSIPPPPPIVEDVEFNPEVFGPFAITPVGHEAYSITIGNRSARFAVVDGKLHMSLMDVASALGYKAARKFAERHCQNITTQKVRMRWKAKGKPGMVAHDITCVDMQDVQNLIAQTNRYVAKEESA